MRNFFSFKKSTHFLDELGMQNDLFFKIPVNTPIDEIEFAVIDTETSGLTKDAELISIGLVLVKQGEIKIDQTLAQNYNWETANDTALVHGELSQALKPEQEKQQLVEMLKFIGNKPLVGHQIAFDISVINKKVNEYFPRFKLKNNQLDTAKIWNRLNRGNNKELNNISLDYLCNQLNITIENRHTALGDAFMTTLVFVKLVERLKKRGIRTSKNLFKKSFGLF
jgi:DNA polymerase III subunit epsilon